MKEIILRMGEIEHVSHGTSLMVGPPRDTHLVPSYVSIIRFGIKTVGLNHFWIHVRSLTDEGNYFAQG